MQKEAFQLGTFTIHRYGVLIAQVPNFNALRDNAGRTPLHYAVGGGTGDTTNRLKLLLDLGADPNVQDRQGWTPLHLAVQQGRADTARVLLDYRASIGVTNANGQKPFDMTRIPTNEFLAPPKRTSFGGF